MLPKVLLTTYHEAFLHHGGGEFELKSMSNALRKNGFIADIYGFDSKNIEEYDIVIHFSVHEGGLNLLEEIKKNKKTIILFPNLYVNNIAPSTNLIGKFASLSDFVVFTSNAMKNHFCQFFDIDISKVKIIDTVFEANIGKQESQALFKSVFNLNEFALTYGILDPNKYQLQAIRVLKKIGLKFVLIGKYRDTDYFQQCKQIGGKETLFIDALAYNSDISNAAFRECTLFIELSKEPAGISAIVAGLNGCRIVLADTEWSRETFGKYAEYVDVESLESIEKGIRGALLSKIDTQSVKKHLEKYIPDNSIVKLKNLLHESLPKSTRIIPKLLLLQRRSMSHDNLMSRSIAARFIPLLTYMKDKNLLRWEQILEDQIKVEDILKFDVLLLNKHTSKHSLKIVQTAKMLNKKIIYDLDDDIFNIPSYSITRLKKHELKNAESMMSLANRITVSTPELQIILKNKGLYCTVLSNGFDHDKFDLNVNNTHSKESKKILFSNTDKLKVIQFKDDFITTLNLFTAKYPEVTIDFWGDEFDGLSRINNLSRKGFLQNDLYKIEIQKSKYLFAVVPLGGIEDTETFDFNKCKSYIKFIDYSSLGIVGIYSNNPVYSNIVDNGVTGIIANNTMEEWFYNMELLYNNPQLRQKIRVHAYEFSRANFSYETQAKLFYQLLYRI